MLEHSDKNVISLEHETKGKQRNTECDVISMMLFLIDKTFFEFGQNFQKIISTAIGTNCVPFLVDISLYSNDAEVIQKLIRLTKYKACNLTIRYIDDVLSIYNTNFANYIPLMYLIEFGKPETRETAFSATFLDI